jgi:putative redox protein
MRFEAADAHGRRLVLDDATGGGGPGPIDALLAALGGCTAMDVISIARKKRQPVAAYRIEVRAVQRETYPMVFERIDVVHVFEGEGLAAAALRRCIELSATKYCPISAMLSAGPVEIHHRYRIVAAGAVVEEGEVVVTGPGALLPPAER